MVPCAHRETITTITAGIAREVCETCAHVSLRFVEAAVRTEPATRPRPVDSILEMLSDRRLGQQAYTAPELRFLKCHLCSQTAVYLIPSGVVCDEHAWQAAARLNWSVSDPWVPIRIDTSSS